MSLSAQAGTGAAAVPQAPIGVFDSGIGGLSILRALRLALPAENFIYYADTGFAPYGERDERFVIDRSLAVAHELVQQHGVKLLVVACNTATAAAIAILRATWPQLPLVGVEPALKPAAALTRTGRIGVLATRGTLASDKFRQLHEGLSSQAQFALQPCDGLAAAIEAHDTPRIASLCSQYVQALGPLGSQAGQIDTVVLGCTHYAFALPLLSKLAGANVKILETGEPVARQTRQLLLDRGLLHPGPGPGGLECLGTGDPAALAEATGRWLTA